MTVMLNRLPMRSNAVLAAVEYGFEAAHFAAVEAEARRVGDTEIRVSHVETTQAARVSGEAAICGACGRFHVLPACGEAA